MDSVFGYQKVSLGIELALSFDRARHHSLDEEAAEQQVNVS